MRKAFTLAETLITMAIIGVIMALSIPAVIQSTNDTKPLFKKAYNSVESIVSDLANNTALYPTGDLSIPASGSFCTNFFSELNTIGTVSCGNAAVTTFPSGVPTGTVADATATNSMIWYNLHPPTSFTPGAACTRPGTLTGCDSAFTAANCDGVNGTALTGIVDSTDSCVTNSCCVKILVDVNGANKGANITTITAANRDIFTIYVTNSGQVTVRTSPTNAYDEAYLLQN